jgi:hypothetical protein
MIVLYHKHTQNLFHFYFLRKRLKKLTQSVIYKKTKASMFKWMLCLCYIMESIRFTIKVKTNSTTWIISLIMRVEFMVKIVYCKIIKCLK